MTDRWADLRAKARACADSNARTGSDPWFIEGTAHSFLALLAEHDALRAALKSVIDAYSATLARGDDMAWGDPDKDEAIIAARAALAAAGEYAP